MFHRTKHLRCVSYLESTAPLRPTLGYPFKVFVVEVGAPTSMHTDGVWLCCMRVVDAARFLTFTPAVIPECHLR
jgi:hypothetical protein